MVKSGLMNERGFEIRPVTIGDVVVLTRLAYANMTGVDRDFTRFTAGRLGRLRGYLLFPFYFLFSGQGYKAVLNEKIVGAAFLHFGQQSSMVYNVSVDHPYRRQGIGRGLMNHLETLTRSQKLTWMALQVDEANLPAQNLYLKLGYVCYHSQFFRRLSGQAFWQKSASGINLELLHYRPGRSLLTYYANLERQAGDSWAAVVVYRDYPPPLPTYGLFWRCLLNQQEVGAAWLGGGYDRPVIMLLLKPEFWGQAIVSLGLIRQILDHATRYPLQIDIHVGSSQHKNKIAPLLEEQGFNQVRQQTLLMLKKL